MLEKQTNLITRLALQQSQRGQSIPTLSVLMGKAIAARQLWAAWLGTTNRQTAVCVYSSHLALFEAWLSVVIRHHDLRMLVIQRLATLVGQPVEQLSAWLASTSDYQRELFWQRLAPVSAETFVLQSLLAVCPGANGSDLQSSESASHWFTHEDAPTIFKHFATVAQIVPSSSVPGLFVLLPEAADHTALPTILTMLTQLVEAVPVLPVGLVLTNKQGEWVLNGFPESRTKAMVRSGLIAIPMPEQNDLKQWLQDRGVNDNERQQLMLELLQKHGATAAALETAVALTDPARQPHSTETDAIYRSQAEQFLFQYLEINPRTVGRFQVNARLEINFGSGRMEVDFLDAAAKIVLELDGYYHFNSLGYRRDRRKDRLLQQHGFLVLRFLAEDVVSGLEEIFDAIDQALTLRQSSVTNYSEA